MSEKVCVVTGVGPGLGGAYVRRFAAGGYRVAMLARSEEKLRALEAEVEGSLGVPCDVSDPASVSAAFETIRDRLGVPDVVVHNAGSGVFKGFLETTHEELQIALGTNIGGLFLLAQEALPGMVEKGGGAFVVTGATASWRGSPKTSVFAAGKGGQRWLAQALAKEFAPQGVHVSYIVIDGMVDLPRTRAWMPERPEDDFLEPAAVAETAWHLAHQSPRAWSFEVDVRPFREGW